MSRATPDDQLKFLLTCVKHSNNGKIDFIEVAKECAIVSKGAAAKRYERLMKANGIHPNGGPAEQQSTTLSKPKERSKASIAKAAAEKRRKIEGPSSNLNDDEEDGKSIVPKSDAAEGQQIKQEPMTRMDSNLAMPVLSSLSGFPSWRSPIGPYTFSNCGVEVQPPEQQYYLPNGHSVFDDFCNPELFTQQGAEPLSSLGVPRSLPPAPQEVVEVQVDVREAQSTAITESPGQEFILIMD